MNSKDDNAVLLAQSQLLERVRNQGTRSADLELFDFQIQVRLPECRSNVEKSGDVGTKHRLGQTMSDESVRRKYGRRSGARQFLFRLLVAGSCGNNEIGIENLRGQRDVYVFRIAADGGDQAFRRVDPRLPQHFIFRCIAHECDHTFVRRPSRAIDTVID